MRRGASARDLAELRSGKASPRDRAEARAGKTVKRRRQRHGTKRRSAGRY